MNEDAELLRSYVEGESERAFASIVDRYKGFVYASALRQTNDPGLAEEVAQAVFVVLARKAASLRPDVILSGWLFRATRYAARDVLKSERRRALREQEGAWMNASQNEPGEEAERAWREMAPVLDASLEDLGELDRHAILLRYFEQKDFAAVGAALGMSADSATKRVHRALEKLRRLLGKRGVVVSGLALGGLLTANAAPVAPAALHITAGSAAVTAATPLIKGTLAFMAWTKTKIAVVSIVALLVLNGGVVLTVLLLHKPESPEASVISEEPAAGTNTNAFSEEALVTTPYIEGAADRDGFVSLFNGRDLSGWNYNPLVWSVTDGVIRARAPVDSRQTVHYLTWAGGEVDDFELRLKVRTSADENSGVPLRARWAQQRWMPGYQAEIHGQRTGLLIIAGSGNERLLSRAEWITAAREVNGVDVLESPEKLADTAGIGAARDAVERGEWCDFAVTARGQRFVIEVNGVTVTDSRDEHPRKFVGRGLLGLEYGHRNGREDQVEFKEIRFRRLKGDGR